VPAIDVVVSSDISLSTRAKQVCGMFDAPPEEKQSIRWTADIPIEQRKWNVGLIVGPSGSGKSTVSRHLFGESMRKFESMEWHGKSMIDDMPKEKSVADIAEMCSAVGFNTIPAWLRPYAVLSNGERFRASIARALLEDHAPIVVDEFTSVVDRQVAQVGCHAIQKVVRKRDKQFVGVACHYDIMEWLQPDWVFEPATRQFAWRSVQRRPSINVTIGRVHKAAWSVFAPFHYLTGELHNGAKCFALWVDGRIASFAGVLHKPHPVNDRIKGVSRLVTLPDWQGLGLSFVLSETVGSAYAALGFDYRHYPAHPSFIRAHRPDKWALVRKPGSIGIYGQGSIMHMNGRKFGRPCASFAYIGPKMDVEQAKAFIA